MRLRLVVLLVAIAAAVAGTIGVRGGVLRAQGQRGAAPGELGYTDTPILPGQPWHVHDPARPHPPMVTPAAVPGGAPSDAIVLFDGKDLSKWAQHGPNGELLAPKWPVHDGIFESGGGGSLYTRESFGSIQLHVEWSAPTPPVGTSQGRGNSGVMPMGLYEIQVLDSFNNVTYADGQAAAIYGQWPPLVNAARKPGEWQTYDIIFEAPRFDGTRVVQPAFQTVFWNGIIVHNRKEVLGPVKHREVATYEPHAAELPLLLQDHANPVRFRNVWVRRLAGYDQPEKK
jgi:3-keto-disaccharide hydrolase